ncbi:MAG: HAMP domain-containing histidine kinase, partial [Candidatus Dormibacteraeota bacterium]|nr:HAMP domain-containing histidine kinase [Candidatus Dormibacteraeota bacterium]
MAARVRIPHPRWPRPTLRLRLTALYGGLFLLSGALLLALVYVLVSRQFGGPLATFRGVSASAIPRLTHGSGFSEVVAGRGSRIEAVELATAELRQLLLWSCVALGAMAVVSMGAGWMVAGRVLRPIRTIMTTAREISARNLHRRLALTGPDDELKELGDTFDDLIQRLEASFQSQRRFVANASHELRTPLTRLQTLLEVALADPHADLTSLRTACERAVVAGREQERLLEALLTLATSERGLGEVRMVDLAAVASDALIGWRSEAGARDVEVSTRLSPASVSGDPRLLERLVTNLLSNAIRYNVAGGRVEIETGTESCQTTLRVVNSGPVVPEDEIPRLLRPFQQLDRARDARDGGSGLGLSIVQAIAAAHGTAASVRARREGGLDV